MTLAARLEKKKQEKEAEGDPDAADKAAVDAASTLPEEPRDVGPGVLTLGDGTAQEGLQLQPTGLRVLGVVSGAGQHSGRFSNDSGSDDSSELDEDDAGRDHTSSRPEGDYEDDDGDQFGGLMMKRRTKGRRPSTTEAKERKPLDDDDDDEKLDAAIGSRYALHSNEGPFADNPEDDDDDDSSDDGIVEIRTRRTS
ncbi:uncharacterized protein K489DRAFT_381108 [Dissoconium aciculare CBS 342.82]|uniref:Uncharacterized protein n=1 Tax=Dissoconium aciculare CBS 342.82 TaxID=1314786 RepID=A0A6J3M300_9PEZI|nr:uncharacterized protein K489DRAFT_381108 [Dissoconium aciculare CBS 342.82]KAF1822365.1 hypothetical protein K489DRAFT_381108 [Dissoconium aciculare CBS 342.82]